MTQATGRAILESRTGSRPLASGWDRLDLAVCSVLAATRTVSARNRERSSLAFGRPVACAAARILESVATIGGQEIPIVPVLVENKPHYAEGLIIADLAIWPNGLVVGVVTFPACPQNEFSDPELRVRLTRRRLRRKAFVVVLMSADHHVRSLCVEIVPKGLRPGRVPVRCPRGKERVVPDGEGTGRRVCREVGAKPLFLTRAVITRDLLAVVVGIKNDDMPGAQIVAVIALSWIAGSRAKVIEIPIGVPGLVFVVTRSGSRPVLEPTPGRVVAVLKFRISA